MKENTQIGKVEVLVFNGGRVEVHSNLQHVEQVRELLNLAMKAVAPRSSFAEVELGKAKPNFGPKIHRN